MLAASKVEFVKYFKEIHDSRDDGRTLYPLHEVIFLTIVAVLCGAESWGSIIKFAKVKSDWLRRFFPFENGFPSKSTLSRMYGLIDKKYFESWLTTWSQELFSNFKNEILALDGKSLNGKGKFSTKFQASHLVSLFATEMGVVLAQTSIDEKSNEIPAMKQLLQQTDLSNSTVTIDAMGCQKEISAIIREKNGDYFLAVKENQKFLHEMVEEYFSLNDSAQLSNYYTVDKGHGRIEERLCVYSNDVNFLKLDHGDWQDLRNIVMVESKRHIKGEIETNRRYYISSHQETCAEFLLNCSRKHWGIENQLHWILDVEFNEDKSLIRQDNAAENMGIVRKVVLNMIKQYQKKTGCKDGVKLLRQSATWDIGVAEDILSAWEVN